MGKYSDNADALKFNALKPSSDRQSPLIVKNTSCGSTQKPCLVPRSPP